jgi:hypothetical protein
MKEGGGMRVRDDIEKREKERGTLACALEKRGKCNV